MFFFNLKITWAIKVWAFLGAFWCLKWVLTTLGGESSLMLEWQSLGLQWWPLSAPSSWGWGTSWRHWKRNAIWICWNRMINSRDREFQGVENDEVSPLTCRVVCQMEIKVIPIGSLYELRNMMCVCCMGQGAVLYCTELSHALQNF